MSKRDGMVQMAELTVYQMRKVVHREWIECSGGVDWPCLKLAAECILEKIREWSYIANDGSTMLPIEQVFGKLTYKIKPVKMHFPAYYRN
ncbi:MAG: hypothetical protein IJG84_11090 [Kiritimatiellae bacterium]|nr:hypothetical protein [Kiritimatiellia bacterium]